MIVQQTRVTQLQHLPNELLVLIYSHLKDAKSIVFLSQCSRKLIAVLRSLFLPLCGPETSFSCSNLIKKLKVSDKVCLFELWLGTQGSSNDCAILVGILRSCRIERYQRKYVDLVLSLSPPPHPSVFSSLENEFRLRIDQAVLELLVIKGGYSLSTNPTPSLLRACLSNNTSLALYVLHHLDSYQATVSRNDQKRVVLAAIESGNPTLLALFLKKGFCRAGQCAQAGFSALYLAIKSNNLEMVKMLLEEEGDVTAPGACLCCTKPTNEHIHGWLNSNTSDPSFGISPLLLAVRMKNLLITRYLIEKGARVISSESSNAGCTPLQTAIMDRNYLMVEFLLKSARAQSIVGGEDVEQVLRDLQSVALGTCHARIIRLFCRA